MDVLTELGEQSKLEFIFIFQFWTIHAKLITIQNKRWNMDYDVDPQLTSAQGSMQLKRILQKKLAIPLKSEN